MLGLLDQDVTGAWFGRGGLSTAFPEIRCTGVLLAVDDGEARAREAYRSILTPLKPSEVAGECG